MPIFAVTGCAGFIGSHLCERLLADGHSVLGFDALTDYYSRRRKARNLEPLLRSAAFTWIEDDIVSCPTLQDKLTSMDGIYHLAAQPGVRASWGEEFHRYLHDNMLATQRIFEAATCRVVYASSSSIYGDAILYPTRETSVARPISPYGVTKLGCEALAEAYGLRKGLATVGLRYFTVYGPRQRPDMAFTRIALALLRGEPFTINGDGRQSRDFTYVSDAVTATIATMENASCAGVYNVGGGEEKSLNEVISIFEKSAGQRLSVRRQQSAEGDVRRTGAETSKLSDATGWAPIVRIADGIQKQLDWARAELEIDGYLE